MAESGGRGGTGTASYARSGECRDNTEEQQAVAGQGVRIVAGRAADADPLELVGQLQRMADEIAHLQSELAAVQALITVTAVDSTPIRPGAGWTPSPEPQPWLNARSA